jgi:hypothetical protein
MDERNPKSQKNLKRQNSKIPKGRGFASSGRLGSLRHDRQGVPLVFFEIWIFGIVKLSLRSVGIL